MRTILSVAIVLATTAACARQPSASLERAAEPHDVALVGCVERGVEAGELVVRGRDVAGTVGTGIGREQGGLRTTTTLGGGDEDRNARPGTPFEERASTLTPRLVAGAGVELASHIGQRVLVRGEFHPAGPSQSGDSVTVASIAEIAPACAQ